MEQNEKEEQQKDRILEYFSKYHNEPESDRQKHFMHFCDQVYRWCKNHLFFNVDSMVFELLNATQRIIKNKTAMSLANDRAGFFKYLIKSLKNAEVENIRNNENDEANIIKISKYKKAKLKKVEDLLRMQESSLGRTLTKDEQILCITKHFKLPDFNDIIKAMKIGSLEFSHGDEEIDNLNSTATPIYMGNISDNPFIENIEIIREAIVFVLNKRQDRNIDCYRALLTLYCIKKYKKLDDLYSVLDKNILDNYQKGGGKPKQYEIYQKFHPNTDKSSAEPIASTIIKDLKKELNEYLKHNHPEIFS